MRRMMILSLAAAFTIPLTANGVRAAAPTVEHISDSGSFVDHEFCGFALHVDWQFRARRYTWTDASGDVTRWAQHGVFSETVRANGKMAYASDRQNIVDAQADSFVVTGTWSFRLPNNSFIRDAGRIVISYEDEVSSVAGPHPIQGTGEYVGRFCETMA